MLYELIIAIVSVAFSFLLYFSFQNFFHTIFYRSDKIQFVERRDLIGKELLYVSVVRMAILFYLSFETTFKKWEGFLKGILLALI